MNDQPDPALKARAKEAYERTVGQSRLPSRQPDPEELARLERAVLTLPRRTREIFLANRLDGYSYAKIADLAGLSVKQVKRHMVKALLRLTRYRDDDKRGALRRWQYRIARWFS